MESPVVVIVVALLGVLGGGGGLVAFYRVRTMAPAEVKSLAQNTATVATEQALKAQQLVNDELRKELAYRDQRIAEQDAKIDSLERKVSAMRSNLDELESEIKHLRQST